MPRISALAICPDAEMIEPIKWVWGEARGGAGHQIPGPEIYTDESAGDSAGQTTMAERARRWLADLQDQFEPRQQRKWGFAETARRAGVRTGARPSG